MPATSLERAVAEYEEHECPCESDVCGCVFRFACPSCGDEVTAFGEDVGAMKHGGVPALCAKCFNEEIM